MYKLLLIISSFFIISDGRNLQVATTDTVTTVPSTTNLITTESTTIPVTTTLQVTTSLQITTSTQQITTKKTTEKKTTQAPVTTQAPITTQVPITTQAPITTTFPFVNMNYYCGASYSTIDCNMRCSSGLDIECANPTYKCFQTIDYCTKTSLIPTTSSLPTTTQKINLLNITNYCGTSENLIDCLQPCPNGLNGECLNKQLTCYDVGNVCNFNPNFSERININIFLTLIIIFTFFLF